MIRRFVFQHINKCAGTTLLYALQDRFSYDECVFMERYSSLPSFGEYDVPDFEDIARARFIHEPSGARNWKSMLPNVSTFAMFRDPINRLYSQWMMVRQWSEAALRSRLGGVEMRDAARVGFIDYLRSSDPNVILDRWNGMTGYFLFGDGPTVERWRALEGPRNPEFARQALDLALSNLRTLDLIGLVEDFEATLDVLALVFPFSRGGKVQSHNTRGERSYRDALDAETLAFAEASTALDRELYATARQHFESQMTRLRRDYGPDLRVAGEAKYEDSLREPPEWALVSMGSALRGAGWQAREVNGMKISRWIGPDPVARIDVPVKKAGQVLIRARCTSFMSPEQIEAFQMRADGAPLSLVTWIHLDRFRYFEAVVPADQLRANAPLRIEFDCGFVQPASDPRDPRRLGLEFSEIEVGPASGFCRGAPGTPSASH